MDASQLKATPSVADHPSRRLIAAGVKHGSGPLVVEQLSPADRAASAAWHAEQSAALYDEAAADARKADNEAEAALCEAYAAGVRAESLRRTVALRGR